MHTYQAYKITYNKIPAYQEIKELLNLTTQDQTHQPIIIQNRDQTLTMLFLQPKTEEQTKQIITQIQNQPNIETITDIPAISTPSYWRT